MESTTLPATVASVLHARCGTGAPAQRPDIRALLQRVAEGFARTFVGNDGGAITPAAGTTWMHEACRDVRADPRITKRVYRLHVRPFVHELLAAHGHPGVPSKGSILRPGGTAGLTRLHVAWGPLLRRLKGDTSTGADAVTDFLFVVKKRASAVFTETLRIGTARRPWSQIPATHPWLVEAVWTEPLYRTVPPMLKAVVPMRWADGPDRAMRFFWLMWHQAERLDNATLRRLVVPCFWLMTRLVPASESPLVGTLNGLRRHQVIRRLQRAVDGASEGRGEYLYRSSEILFQFRAGEAWSGLLEWRNRDWAPFTARELGVGGGQHRKRQRARDAFTDAELERLEEECRKSADPRDLAIMLFLNQTGCRRGAIRNLRVDDVVESGAGGDTELRMRTVGSVREKRTKGSGPVARREFDLTPALADALRRAIAANGGSPWVFPNPQAPLRPSGHSYVYGWLRRLCARVGIHGDHVHPHALRRSCITRLLDQPGNRIEDVCRWVGHRSVAMTAHYEEWNAERLRRRVCTPWGRTAQGGPTNADVDVVVADGFSDVDVSEDLVAYARELGVKDAMIDALEETVQRLANYIHYVETERMGPEDRAAAERWKEANWSNESGAGP